MNTKTGFALLALLSGCAEGTLPDYNRLGGLRILAMKADFPEVAPGTPVVITPVVSDLPATSSTPARTLTFSAEGCIDPGVSLGAAPSCAGRPDRVVITVPSNTITNLASAANTVTGDAPTLSVTVPAAILANRSDADQFNGVAYLVVYTLIATDAAGATQTLTSFKRIIASSRPTKNQNPSITDVLVNEQSLTSHLAALTYPGSSTIKSILVPSFSATSAETYEQRTSQTNAEVETQTESLTTTWFLSDGEINRFRTVGTEGNEWTPPAKVPSRPGQVIVVVTRDGRGGEDYRKYEY